MIRTSLLLLAVGISATLAVPSCDQIISNVTEIEEIVGKWNTTMTELWQIAIQYEWAWASNLTDYNLEKKNEQNAKVAEKTKEVWKEAVCINCTQCEAITSRSVLFYRTIDLAALPPYDYEEYMYIQATMEDIYGKAKVCLPNGGKCLPLEPDLYEIIGESRDYCELQWAWEGWRNESGRKMRGYYTGYIHLQNQAALQNEFEEAKDMWTKSYWRDEPDFFNQIEAAWQMVKPLYAKLHAYVRKNLKENYPNNPFPASGHIPAHLLGNMWAQGWGSIYDLVIPDRTATAIDVTKLLQDANKNETDLYHIADDFFQSLGMEPMTQTFWEKSILLKPDTELICHASAWDFYKLDDFRIKQCTTVSAGQFKTVHHEMGHIQYFMNYKDQPIEFRNGANPGFHEAIGDLIALSVMTPDHLKTIGLLDDKTEVTEGTYLNSMMDMALGKIAFLPFGYLMDKYRWDLFTQTTSFSDLNKSWWKLRSQMQGISPPVTRSEDDFDPGAKYHIPASVPYIRYFFSHIAQFQFHKALCKEMGMTTDWHKCDIYKQKEAAKILIDALDLGQSVPYPEVLKRFTGNDTLDAQPLLDYFKPLEEFLDKELAGYTGADEVGWTEPYTIAADTCDYNLLNPAPTPEPCIGSRTLGGVNVALLALLLLGQMIRNLF